MKYSRPRLHSLAEKTSMGQCVDGSGAGIDSTCGLGGDFGGGGFCTTGSVNALACISGNAAGTGAGSCLTGTGADTGCATGNSAVGA
jgi:hypothetical protein